MKVKHLLLIPMLIYILYLNIYTIIHIDLFNKLNPTPFEIFAALIFALTCLTSILFISFFIHMQKKKIINFLNQKIL